MYPFWHLGAWDQPMAEHEWLNTFPNFTKKPKKWKSAAWQEMMTTLLMFTITEPQMNNLILLRRYDAILWHQQTDFQMYHVYI